MLTFPWVLTVLSRLISAGLGLYEPSISISELISLLVSSFSLCLLALGHLCRSRLTSMI